MFKIFLPCASPGTFWLQLPADVKWHFIGHLQSNKAKPLVRT